MSSPQHQNAAMMKAMRRMRRNQHGSAAIEFALVAPIFFGMLFAILEVGLTFMAGQVLENGLQISARKMFTHEAADSNMTREAFMTDLCDQVSMLMDCSQLRVNVSLTKEGEEILLKKPILNGKFVDEFNYENPKSGTSQTVVVSAFYQWPLIVTQLGYNLANIDRNTANSKYLLAAITAFRVEPK